MPQWKKIRKRRGKYPRDTFCVCAMADQTLLRIPRGRAGNATHAEFFVDEDDRVAVMFNKRSDGMKIRNSGRKGSNGMQCCTIPKQIGVRYPLGTTGVELKPEGGLFVIKVKE